MMRPETRDAPSGVRRPAIHQMAEMMRDTCEALVHHVLLNELSNLLYTAK